VKRKPGRPPRAGKVARERIEIRATTAERRAWERAAGDVPLSMWLRDAANAATAKDAS
jgi:hypothetical protein